LSPKKRIFDLAKEYGMSGKELAAKLQDLGFTQIKSHMTALSEFELLEIQARLEAYGIVGESSGEGPATMGGLKIKRRKKAKKEPEAEEPPAEEPAAEEPAEPAPDEEPEEPGRPAEAEPAPVAPEAKPAPKPAAEPAPAPAAAEAMPVPEVAEPEVAERAAEPAAAAPEVETPEPAAPPVQAPEPEPQAPAAATPEQAPVSQETSGGEIVRPAANRRPGKVVGFIDPSQFQTRPVRKAESRRLRSADDVAPQVMPTLGKHRRSPFVRGDAGSRNQLTAQQLREREAGRFLRRNKPVAERGGGRRGGGRGGGGSEATGSPYSGQTVQIDEPITIKKLAHTLAVAQNLVLREAFRQLGFGNVNINSTIDEDTAQLLAQEFDVELDVEKEVTAEEALIAEFTEARESVEAEHLAPRAPCVAFLGHVDHGKTTLIDTIRTSRIASGEAGGITQHIGAYQVQTKKGHTLTIVDTPGHAAFTAMRARGATAVDIVVLVVAADDGVKPQTEEAFNHARAAGVPIVVAMNKMDKPEANPDRVRNELSALGLTPEGWGGDTAMLEVSGLKGDGVEELLERVFLESEVLELRSHPTGPATGVVLEAEILKGKGKTAHLLVQDGCLKTGDVILAGEGYGKVRSIHNDRGKVIQEAGPATPIEVTGLNELPFVGDRFHVVESLDRAQEVAREVARKNRDLQLIERRQVSKENLFEAVADSQKTVINLIIKADVQGSVEVLKHQLGDFSHEEVVVKVLHAGVGEVLESDVDLAATSDATILAFHVNANAKARPALERHGVTMHYYEVIYELLDDVRMMMEGTLAPEVKEEVTGHAEIRRIFRSSKIGNIGGCFVLDGTIGRNDRARLVRDGQVLHTGTIGTLRREKDDAKEVREGFECGIVLKDYSDIKEGDVIETYKLVEVKRTI
jgi:translation initiation factor IF-2